MAGRATGWRDAYEPVFLARERWIASGSAADKQHFDAEFEAYRARFNCDTCSHEGRLCHCEIKLDAQTVHLVPLGDGSKGTQVRLEPDEKQALAAAAAAGLSNELTDEQAAAAAGALKSFRAEHSRAFPKTERKADMADLPKVPWLRPLTANGGLSSVTPEQARQAELDHLARSGQANIHAREQLRLQRKIRQTKLDAKDDKRGLGAFDQPATPPSKVPPNKVTITPAGGTVRGQAHRAEVPAWKRPLTMTSERTPPLPSQATAFAPIGQRARGAFDGFGRKPDHGDDDGDGPDDVA